MQKKGRNKKGIQQIQGFISELFNIILISAYAQSNININKKKFNRLSILKHSMQICKR